MTTPVGEDVDGPAAGAVDVWIGASVAAWTAFRRITRPVSLPRPLGRPLEPILRRLADDGRSARSRLVRTAEEQLDRIVPSATEAFLSRVDLASLVAKYVDLDRLVEAVDVDAAARRLDLAAIANDAVDAVDLPGMIRQSSGSFTAEAVRGARIQGVEADQAIARVVDRLRPRRRSHEPEAARLDHGTNRDADGDVTA